MELSKNEIMQYLEELQVPEDFCGKCRDLAREEQYEELYLNLRRVRKQFLNEMHAAQGRLDQLDRLIYDMKKKSEDK